VEILVKQQALDIFVALGESDGVSQKRKEI